MSLIVTLPQPIDETTLISSNVPTGDYPDWVAAGGTGTNGAYVRGTRVVQGIEAYEVVAVETLDAPEVGVGLTSPTWLRLGYINRHRMFTETRDSTTYVAAGDIDVKFTSKDDYYNLVALLGLKGTSVTIEVLDPLDVVKQTTTVSLVDVGVGTWYDYFEAPYGITEAIVLDRVLYLSGAKIRVLISGGGEDTACGRVVIGRAELVGTTDYGTSVGLLTFSQFIRDGFGNLTVKEGRTVNTADFSATVETDYVDSAMQILRRAGGKIALYVGDSNKEATYILGIAEQPRIDYDDYTFSSLSLEVQGQ